MYTYKSHVNNINFITKKPFQVALTKDKLLSMRPHEATRHSFVTYVEWHPHASVQIIIVHILNVIMWIEVEIQDMTFLKGGGCLYM